MIDGLADTVFPWRVRRKLLNIDVRGAGVAQLVERDLAKVEVVGSRPITRSI
jgi:hypothetical protein